MATRLENRVAIVTGGAEGIGEGCARALSEEGAAVVIADIQEAKAQALVATMASNQNETSFVRTDVLAVDDIESCVRQTVERYGRLDVLVNNAGVHFPHTIDDLTPERWEHILNLNLRSMFLFCKGSLPEIRKRRGAVVNVSSLRGLTGQANAVAYCASKAGVLGLTMGLAKDEAKHQVRVNAVCPSNVLTPLLTKWLSQLEDPGDMRRVCEQEQALGRMADIMEVGRVVAFLAGPDASFLTGLCMPVDGGAMLG